MNILVGARQRKIRQALRLLLEEEFAAKVTEAETAEQLEEKVRASSYELLLLSWGLLEADALHGIQQLRTEAKGAAMVVLVRNHDEANSAEAAGAEHTFDRTLPPTKLTALLKAIIDSSRDQDRKSKMPKDHWVLTEKHIKNGK